MRRAFSIFLLFFFGLGPLAAVLPAADDVRVPICCRRNGLHHCAITAEVAAALARMMAQDTRPGLSAPLTCPSYPGCIALVTAPDAVLTAQALSMPFIQRPAHSSAAGHDDAPENSVLPLAGRGPPYTL